jgi:hypothetical protein
MSDKLFIRVFGVQGQTIKDKKATFSKTLDALIKEGEALLESGDLTRSEEKFVSNVLIAVQHEREVLTAKVINGTHGVVQKPGL